MDLQHLKEQLQKNNWAPVYLFYGEETYLKEKALVLLKNSLPGDSLDFNLDLVDGKETTPEHIVALAQTLPFFGERRLVIVQDAELFSGKGSAKGKSKVNEENPGGEEPAGVSPEVLLNYLANPAPHTCIVFTATAVDRKRKLYKAVEKAGVVLECQPLKGQALYQWARERIRKTGKTIHNDALTRLCLGNTGGLLQLEQDLEKILTYLDDEQVITFVMVDALLPPNLENNIFALIDAAGNRRYEEARRLLIRMLQWGEPYPRLIAMLARQFRLILKGKLLLQQGFAEKQVAAELKLHPFVTQKCLAQGKNFSVEELEEALIKLANLDAASKKGLVDPERGLDMTLLELIDKKT